jgi:homoserine dehydrogenase
VATRIRIWVVGLGTVGQWLLRALDANERRLEEAYGIAFDVVAIANRRDGLIFRDEGLDIRAACDAASRGESLLELEHAERWPTALEGLRATSAHILVEISASPVSDGEPGLAHMRDALQRRVGVVTSNKWPVALHGLELRRLAEEASVAFRCESTVMSGTPVLGPLTEGLAGASPVALRGVLNATVNFILTRMADGIDYEQALAEARGNGLAERDPSDDVDGNDAVAKVMILAGLVFGRQLRPQDVSRRGVSAIAESDVDRARASTVTGSGRSRASSLWGRRSTVTSAPAWNQSRLDRATRSPPSMGRLTPSCAGWLHWVRSRSSAPAPGWSSRVRGCSVI